MKTIGILGGMGPQASARFYEKLISESIRLGGAKENNGFPHIILNSLSVRDIIGDLENAEETVHAVHLGAKTLEKAGADFIVMACNTMHLYQNEITRGLKVPFVSMICVVCDRIKKDGIKCVGLLGSRTTIESDLYGKALNKNVQLIRPDNDSSIILAEVIKKIIAGTTTINDSTFLKKEMTDMVKKGAQAIILGCTELPLIINADNATAPIYDSPALLAEETIKKAFE